MKFLRHYAGYLLRNADVYNAVKPGLYSFSYGPDGEVPLLEATGPSLRYLEEVRDENRREHWQVTTVWIDVDLVLALIRIGHRMMESLWRVARARYLTRATFDVRLFDSPAYDALIDASTTGPSGIELHRISEQLIYATSNGSPVK